MNSIKLFLNFLWTLKLKLSDSSKKYSRNTTTLYEIPLNLNCMCDLIPLSKIGSHMQLFDSQHFPPGHYQSRTQSFCLLQNKASVTITGNASDDTIIECIAIEPFNIVFLRSQNIVISNVKCGNVVNDFIKQSSL